MEISSPPSVLTFASLADLFEQYERLFLNRNLRCPRGKRIIFETYHFFHLVKLRKGHQTRFLMSEEKEMMMATTRGFGEYSLDQKRAETLPWILDIIAQPHEIYEYETKRTADEVLIKEYKKSGSPYKVLLVVREEDYLLPVTSMTVRRPAIKEHHRGRLLWQAK